MRYATIKKAGQDEQQNETPTTTTKMNYIKNLKKIHSKQNSKFKTISFKNKIQ